MTRQILKNRSGNIKVDLFITQNFIINLTANTWVANEKLMPRKDFWPPEAFLYSKTLHHALCAYNLSKKKTCLQLNDAGICMWVIYFQKCFPKICTHNLQPHIHEMLVNLKNL